MTRPKSSTKQPTRRLRTAGRTRVPVPAGRATGHWLARLRVPAHRATTRNLQALYPFVVDSGLGSRGVYVGRESGSDASFVHDPWQQYQAGVVTNPNMSSAGSDGGSHSTEG